MTRIEMPEETANRLLGERWATPLVPNICGQWFYNSMTRKTVFVAEVPDQLAAEFIEGIRRLEEGQERG